MEEDKLKAREILFKKLGISKQYKSRDREIDGVADSLEFTYEDVKFLENEDISKEEFYKIYEDYKDQLINIIKRNNRLRIPTLQDRNGEICTFVEFDRQRTLESFEKFFSGEDSLLKEDNKIVMLEIFNILKTYPIKYLQDEEKSKVIKQEIDSGLYDLIKFGKNQLTDEERKCIFDISDNWDKQDMLNYKNLKLLRKRYNDILESDNINDKQKVINNIAQIDALIEKGIPQKGENISEIKGFSEEMSTLYLDFEHENRRDILDNTFSINGPTLINNQKDLKKNVLIHFYFKEVEQKLKEVLSPLYKQTIVNKIKSDELLTDEEVLEKYSETIEVEMKKIDNLVDELNPGESVKLPEYEVSQGRLDALIGAQNQVAVYFSDLEHVLYSTDYRSRNGMTLAVGFDRNVVLEENIILSCDKNAFSNFGEDSIPYEDKFVEHSHTRKEIIESEADRTEVLLSREKNGKKIKAAYIFCLCERDLNNDKEARKIYEDYQNEALSRGINFLCVDKFCIDKEKSERSKNNDCNIEL